MLLGIIIIDKKPFIDKIKKLEINLPLCYVNNQTSSSYAFNIFILSLFYLEIRVGKQTFLT